MTVAGKAVNASQSRETETQAVEIHIRSMFLGPNLRSVHVRKFHLRHFHLRHLRKFHQWVSRRAGSQAAFLAVVWVRPLTSPRIYPTSLPASRQKM